MLQVDRPCSTLIELLTFQSAHHPDRIAFRFLEDGEQETATLTFSQLESRARAIAVDLQERGLSPGDRVLLLYPSSLNFIAAYLGCLSAGLIAVPAYPPRRNQNAKRIQSIVADAQAQVALTEQTWVETITKHQQQDQDLASLTLIATDALSPEQIGTGAGLWRPPQVGAETIAFLQYTSGSTGDPKGVMVTHGNILHNLRMIQQAFGHDESTVGVGWLPLFHDMGLIGNVLQPLYLGACCTFMPPGAFLQRPIRWLRAISRYGATTSGGPNFAYDLCVDQISSEQTLGLDLSSWQVAFNGAEPIRARTLHRFAAAFAPCGFQEKALYACYGMAETTLLISGGIPSQPPVVKQIKASALGQNQVIEVDSSDPDRQTVVGCGRSLLEQDIVVVDPDSRQRCTPEQVGEIWVSGPHVAQGYWGRQQLTQETFRAHLRDDDPRSYLRTGDLGFLDRDGELYITGRLKDVIIIRGRNHYPQDIEATVERCHPALRAYGGAAFTVEVGGENQLIIVQELERSALRTFDPKQVFSAIRRAISGGHDLQVNGILLLKTASLPKTSSGKVQRRACRSAYLSRQLNSVAEWRDHSLEPDPLTDQPERPADPSMDQTKAHPTDQTNCPTDRPIEPDRISPASSSEGDRDQGRSSPTQAQIQSWLIRRIAAQLKVTPESLDSHRPLAEYGLSSMVAVQLSGDLEEWLGRALSPTLLYDYPSIQDLAQFLSSPSTSPHPHSPPAVAGLAPDPKLTLSEPMAVIGLGCRFPGSEHPEAFWQLLHDGREAIGEIPRQRWDIEAFFDPDPAAPGKTYARHGGFLPRIEDFDPSFFRISPREALTLDPQQRLLLEVSWEALEHAGIDPHRLEGTRTGVFVGISSSDYFSHILQTQSPIQIDSYLGTGASHSVAAGRISYFLGLTGPSLAIDTACSSSLVAVHTACQSLRNGDCDLALVGGVNLLLSPEIFITLSKARMLAADGRCKTFDASADGYVRGEGCGVVILKPLSQAELHGDPILAVIRGSAINQDGQSNGLTAPSGLSQQTLIQQALDQSGISPEAVSYVEAHGTGTVLGDPIEVGSLAAALGQNRDANPLLIGSVKTNIGHLEGAAGIAGLIKVVLALQHEQIPAHLHVQQPNPLINWEQLPIQVVKQRVDWQRDTQPRIAGVSSFGFSGTNAHVILEEAPISLPHPSQRERPLHLLTLSAKTPSALTQLAEQYEHYLDDQNLDDQIPSDPALDLANICFTANGGRVHFAHRLALIGASRDQLLDPLRRFRRGEDPLSTLWIGERATAQSDVVMVFTGQGSQYVGMGEQLYRTQPTFQRTLDRCAEILSGHLAQPLLEVIFGSSASDSASGSGSASGSALASSLLDETAYTQPALFALEYALYQLWCSWGIRPAAVMGHSVGEYVAACVAGVFSLEEGLQLIAERGRLMQALPSDGSMISVMADPARVEAILGAYGDQVSVAAFNGPESLVLSGHRSAVEQIATELTAQGIKVKSLQVSQGFHSALMDPLLSEFESIARQITYSAPQIRLISNVTGQEAGQEIATPDYWVRHVRQPVRFAQGIQTLHQQGYGRFLEIGPKPVLLGMGRQCLPEEGGLWLPSLRPGHSDWQQMLQSLSQLYVSGAEIDWLGFERDYPHRQKVSGLPTYPFQRQRYWIETDPSPSTGRSLSRSLSRSVSTSLHPLLGQRLSLPDTQAVRFEARLSQRIPAYLGAHRIFGSAVVPGSGYLEMALAAGQQVFAGQILRVEQVEFVRPLVLPGDDQEITVHVVLHLEESPPSPHRAHWQIFSLNDLDDPATTESDRWTLHAQGQIAIPSLTEIPQLQDLKTLDDLKADFQDELPASESKAILDRVYGPLLQNLQRVWIAPEAALSQIQLQETLVAEIENYQIHPALLDGGLQTLALLVANTSEHPYLPVGCARCICYRRPTAEVWSFVQLRGPVEDPQVLMADVHLFTPQGETIATLEGIAARQISEQVLLGAQAPEERIEENLVYGLEWQVRARFDRVEDPDFIPSPASITDSLDPQVQQLLHTPELDRYAQDLVPQLERASLAYILEALQGLGWTYEVGQSIQLAEICQRLGVISQHHRLLARLLDILSEEGILRRQPDDRPNHPDHSDHPDRWRVCQALPEPGNPLPLGPEESQYAEWILLQRCGSQLAAVLQGRIDPVQLVFPAGDLTTATQLYQDSPSARVLNSLLQQVVSGALAAAPDHRGLRLLEVGAGTGGTTRYLLPHLPEDRTRYCFTDVGTLFLQKARERFQDFPFIDHQVLDIEQDPTAQGFEPHQQDIVIAANVLHATQNLRQTLGHVHRLLAPGGLLVLSEITQPQRWLDLIFGLLEGWWRFADGDLRSGYPLLNPGQWQQLLQDCGFSLVSALPDHHRDRDLGQAILVAQADRPKAPHPQENGSWLILADQKGLGQHLANRLRRRGERCALVTTQGHLPEADPQTWQIDVEAPEAYQQIVEQLRSEGLPLRGVVHCWSLDTPDNEALISDLQALDAGLTVGTRSLLHLTQALMAAGFSTPPKLWIVTHNAQAVDETDVQLAQATQLGLGRTIASERPEVWGGMIDLDQQDPIQDQAGQVLTEILSPGEETQLAYRAGKRHVARLTRSTLPPPSTSLIRSDSTYLITGGLGELGLKVAQHLVHRGARHLVLIGRRGVTTEKQQEIISHLEDAGVKLKIMATDISQRSAVAQALAEIDTTMPSLAGIVHAAGTFDYALLDSLSWDLFEQVMRPKVWGTWHLYQLTQRQELDFFVCFSSIASWLGFPGQSNYGAANAFMDSLAHFQGGQNRSVTTIGWGVWGVQEIRTSLPAATKNALVRQQQQGIQSLTAQQGLHHFDRLLQRPGLTGVMSIDWDLFAHQASLQGIKHPFLEDILTALRQQQKRDLSIPSVEQKQSHPKVTIQNADDLAHHLRSELANILGFPSADSIALEQNLMEIGLDSLMAVELRNRVRTQLQIELPLQDLLGGITIQQLATSIFGQALLSEQEISAQDKAAPTDHSYVEPKQLSLQSIWRTDPIPLSYGQERLWTVSQHLPAGGETVYNLPLALRIRGAFNQDAMDYALMKISHRHEIYRTSIVDREGQGIQVIHPPTDWTIPIKDLSTLTDEEKDQALNQIIETEAKTPFPFDSGSLWRACLIKLEKNDYVLMFVWHHIITDGNTILLFLREIEEHYRSYLTQTLDQTDGEIPQYADYAIWQRQQFQKPAQIEDQRYWRRQLAGDLHLLKLPTAQGWGGLDYQGSKEQIEIPQSLLESLKQISRREGITLSTLLLSALKILLYCYTGQKDLIVCIPVAGRNQTELEHLHGYLSNLIPIRIQVLASMSFRELLSQVGEVVLSSLQHAELPFQWISAIAESSGVNLARALFDYEVFPDSPLAGLGFEVSYLPVDTGMANFDIGFFVKQIGQSLVVILEYKCSLFEQHEIEEILRSYTRVLEQIATDQEITLGEMLIALDVKQVVQHHKDSSIDYVAPRNETEEKLAEIWSSLLGKHSIGIRDNFFEAGGNSLIATQMIKQIENQFRRELSLSEIASATTIELQAKLLADRSGTSTWSPIVTLQPRGDQPPFFGFHGGFGDAFVYRSLAELLGKDQPFYGLQARWWGTELESLTTIETMASDFLDAILRVQPHGPYQLIGYSGGGFIAYEAAQQLIARGERVEHLVLVDTFADTAGMIVNALQSNKIQLASARLKFIADIFSEYEVEISREEKVIRRGLSFIPRILWFIRYMIIRSRQGRAIMRRAMRGYAIQPYPSKLTLIRTEAEDELYTKYAEYKSENLGWDRFVMEEITVIKVPGKHHNVLRYPYVEAVARELKQLMRMNNDNIKTLP